LPLSTYSPCHLPTPSGIAAHAHHQKAFSNEARLLEAVELARAHSRSWNQVAVAPDASRQAARLRSPPRCALDGYPDHHQLTQPRSDGGSTPLALVHLTGQPEFVDLASATRSSSCSSVSPQRLSGEVTQRAERVLLTVDRGPQVLAAGQACTDSEDVFVADLTYTEAVATASVEAHIQ